MNELLRALIAGAVGALVATAVLVGQPAVADQVDKAKAKKVTSAMIKNGTIKPADLNAGVKASLAKADTALQKVASGSVTTVEIADGSVSSADVANESLTAGDLAPNSVTSGEVADQSLGADDLAADSVTSSQVADQSLGADDLAADSVTGSEVGDGSLGLEDFNSIRGFRNVDFPNLGPGECAVSGGSDVGINLDGDFILVSNPPTVAGALQIDGRQSSVTPTSFEIVVCNVGTGAFDPPAATFMYAILRN